MKIIAEAESGVVGVPVVVQPVPVELNPVAIVVEIRGVQVAVVVPHEMYEISSVPLPFEYSLGCIVFGIAMP